MTRNEAPGASAHTPDCSQTEAVRAARREMFDAAIAGERRNVLARGAETASDAIVPGTSPTAVCGRDAIGSVGMREKGPQAVAHGERRGASIYEGAPGGAELGGAARPVLSALLLTRLGRVAIFAGTTEGHELCRVLSARGMGATAFVATDYGAELLAGLPGIEVRAGRLSEPEMETALARPARFDVIVDATHPYAAEASANIRTAAERLGMRYLRLLRPATLEGAPASDGPCVVEVPDAASAVRFLAGTEGPVLLTTGSKDLSTFATLPDFATRLYARILPDAAAVARARELGFPPAHLICMQGPFPREMNVATLRMIGARWMVTKDAGRPGGMPEKIAAAREADVDLVVIARPPEPGTTYSFEQVLALLVGDAPCP